jgi:hypothetical protein
MNNREIKISFNDVKNYINDNCKWVTYKQFNAEPILDAVEPFVMNYIIIPVGYYETNNLNDKNEIIKKLDASLFGIMTDDGRKVKSHISRTVKIETERWKERNAWFYGRYIGRLAYLLNEELKLTQVVSK